MFKKTDYIALNTIIKKEVSRFFRIWPQTILPSAITMTLYFVIFGNLIGPRIGQMAGFDYMQYIAPGLIMMSIIINSYTHVVSGFFSMRFQKSIEEVLVSPTPHSILLMGFVSGGIIRGLIVGLVTTVIALFFTHLTIHHLTITILSVLLTSLLFCMVGFLNAIFARKFDDIAIVPTFVLTPLTYLGGVFYSISELPEFWQKISYFNPILYMVHAFRYGILGVSDIDVTRSFVVIAIVIIGLFGLNLHLLNTGRGIRS